VGSIGPRGVGPAAESIRGLRDNQKHRHVATIRCTGSKNHEAGMRVLVRASSHYYSCWLVNPAPKEPKMGHLWGVQGGESVARMSICFPWDAACWTMWGIARVSHSAVAGRARGMVPQSERYCKHRRRGIVAQRQPPGARALQLGLTGLRCTSATWPYRNAFVVYVVYMTVYLFLCTLQQYLSIIPRISAKLATMYYLLCLVFYKYAYIARIIAGCRCWCNNISWSSPVLRVAQLLYSPVTGTSSWINQTS